MFSIMAHEQVRRALLYAHRAMAQDPILMVPEYEEEYWGQSDAFVSALQFWANLHPLIEDKVLELTPELDGVEGLGNDYSILARNADILAQYLQMHPDDEWRFKGEDLQGADLCEVASMQPNAVVAELGHGTLGTITYPGTSHWFGHEDDFELFLRIARTNEMRLRGRRGEVKKAVAIARIEVPDISQIRPSDVISIRKRSEIFEDWRAVLSDALEATEEIATNGHVTTEGLEEIRLSLAAAAAKTRREIAGIRKDASLGALRSMGFGTIAAAAGGAIDGTLGIISGVVGATLEAALDAGKDLIDAREKIVGRRAFVRHAAVVSNDGLG